MRQIYMHHIELDSLDSTADSYINEMFFFFLLFLFFFLFYRKRLTTFIIASRYIEMLQDYKLTEQKY